jgi:exonuclease VII small subunit
MKTENIPDEAKSKSIKEIKEEINQILEKLENKDTNLPESMNEYARLLSLNKKIDSLFKKRSKEISSTGKEKEKKKEKNKL